MRDKYNHYLYIVVFSLAKKWRLCTIKSFFGGNRLQNRDCIKQKTYKNERTFHLQENERRSVFSTLQR